MAPGSHRIGTVIGSAIAFIIVVATICAFGWLSMRQSDVPLRRAWIAAVDATDQVDFLEATDGTAPYENRYWYSHLDEEGKQRYEALYRNLYFMRDDAFQFRTFQAFDNTFCQRNRRMLRITSRRKCV